MCIYVFFFKQKTAYEMRISDWTSDVCSSDLVELGGERIPAGASVMLLPGSANRDSATWPDPDRLDLDHDNRRHLGFGTGIHVCPAIGRASCRERVCQYV